jgi:hypothetical protein
MNIKVNITDSKKDIVHAGNATTMFKDVIGDTININGVLIYDKEETDEKTGEVTTKTVSCVKKDDGEFISSISPTIENSLQTLLGAYSEDEVREGIEIVVKSKKSNGGRDFLYIDIA